MDLPGMTAFPPGTMDYLSGKKLSGFHKVPISSREREIPLRQPLLEALLRDRRVVHLGFADHLPYIAGKVADGTWLHAGLARSARRCLGVDIDAEAVAFVRDELGIEDVLCADIAAEAVPEIAGERWDCMLMGEILEHLDNPVEFLSRIRELYAGSIGRLVLTVPNAFWVKNFEGATRHRERLNTDHRYWFTAYTLGKVAVRAGWEPEGFRFCERRAVPKRIKRLLLKRFPALRESLVMVVRDGSGGGGASAAD